MDPLDLAANHALVQVRLDLEEARASGNAERVRELEEAAAIILQEAEDRVAEITRLTDELRADVE